MKKFALLGKDISYSLSPKLHSIIGEDFGIDLDYSIIDTKSLSNINQSGLNIRDYLIYKELDGINVTIPYKQEIIPYLDKQSTSSKEIGAVNTVIVRREGDDVLLIGENTDLFGFEFSLKQLFEKIEFINSNLDCKHGSIFAIVLGNGGASKTVCHVLEKYDIKYLVLLRKKMSDFELNADLLPKNTKRYVIINATPMGSSEKSPILINHKIISDSIAVLDLTYARTSYIQSFADIAGKYGTIYLDGRAMLVAQGFQAEMLWNPEMSEKIYEKINSEFLDENHKNLDEYIQKLIKKIWGSN